MLYAESPRKRLIWAFMGHWGQVTTHMPQRMATDTSRIVNYSHSTGHARSVERQLGIGWVFVCLGAKLQGGRGGKG